MPIIFVGSAPVVRPVERLFNVFYEVDAGMTIRTKRAMIRAFDADKARSLFLQQNKGKVVNADIKSVVMNPAAFGVSR